MPISRTQEPQVQTLSSPSATSTPRTASEHRAKQPATASKPSLTRTSKPSHNLRNQVSPTPPTCQPKTASTVASNQSLAQMFQTMFPCKSPACQAKSPATPSLATSLCPSQVLKPLKCQVSLNSQFLVRTTLLQITNDEK